MRKFLQQAVRACRATIALVTGKHMATHMADLQREFPQRASRRGGRTQSRGGLDTPTGCACTAYTKGLMLLHSDIIDKMYTTRCSTSMYSTGAQSVHGERRARTVQEVADGGGGGPHGQPDAGLPRLQPTQHLNALQSGDKDLLHKRRQRGGAASGAAAGGNLTQSPMAHKHQLHEDMHAVSCLTAMQCFKHAPLSLPHSTMIQVFYVIYTYRAAITQAEELQTRLYRLQGSPLTATGFYS